MTGRAQEYKVVDTDTNTEVFFFEYAFKSALWHAEHYVKRNISKFPMSLYSKDWGAKTKQPWVLVKNYAIEQPNAE